jgi:hypothetical protein
MMASARRALLALPLPPQDIANPAYSLLHEESVCGTGRRYMRPQDTDWLLTPAASPLDSTELTALRQLNKRNQVLSLVDSAGSSSFVQEQHKDAPEIDYGAWLRGATTAKTLELTKLRAELLQVITRSRTSNPTGQWSRLEQQHGRLRAKYPDSGWAQAVASGLKYTLRALPPQTWIPPQRSDPLSTRVMDACMENWFASGIAAPIPPWKINQAKNGQRSLRFLPLFVIQKPGKLLYEEFTVETVLSKYRPCLNGKSLNDFLVHGYFKQHSARDLDSLSSKHDWTIKLDGFSAFQILTMSEDPIDTDRFGATSSTDMMCFTLSPQLAAKYNCPNGAQVLVNSFGMAPAPLYYNKPKRLITQQIKTMGIRMGVVMDDDSISAESPLLCLQQALRVAKLYEHYGLPLSSKDAEKDTVPTREKEISGMLYVHYMRMKFWPPRKATATLHRFRRLLKRNRKGKIRATEMASILGQLESASQGLFGAKLFLDGLSIDLRMTLNSTSPSSYSNYGKLSEHTKLQLRHLLLDEFKSLQGRQIIHGEAITYQLQTDWCPYGYGVVVPPNRHSAN